MIATTKPRITIVSGIASRMIIVADVSGFSATVPAPAEPILEHTALSLESAGGGPAGGR